MENFFRDRDITAQSLDTLKLKTDTANYELRRHSEYLMSIESALNRNELLSSSEDEAKSLADCYNDSDLRTLLGHVKTFSQLPSRFVPSRLPNLVISDAQSLISTSLNTNKISVWRMQPSPHFVKFFNGHFEEVRCCLLYQTFKLITGSSDKTIK